MAHGLDITAWPIRFQASLANEWFCHQRHTANLLIGCIDTHLGTYFNLTPTAMRPRLATKANILLEC